MNFPRDNENGYGQHGYRSGFAPINNTPQNLPINIVNSLTEANYRQHPYRNPHANINISNTVAPPVISQGQEYQRAYGFGPKNNVPQYIASPPHQYAPQHQHPLPTVHQNTVPMNQIPPDYCGTSNNDGIQLNQTLQESPMNFRVPSNETQTSNDSFSLGALHQMDIDNDGNPLQKNDETIDFDTLLKITEPLPVLAVEEVDEFLANANPSNYAPSVQQEVTNHHHDQAPGGMNLSYQAPVNPLMLSNNHSFVPKNVVAKIRHPKRVGNSSISQKHQISANLPPIRNQQPNMEIENANVENVRVETRGRKPKYTTKQEKQAARKVSVQTYFNNNQSAAARNLQRTLLEKDCEKLETENTVLKETCSKFHNRVLELQGLLTFEGDKNYAEQEILRIQQIGQNKAEEESETEIESEEDV